MDGQDNHKLCDQTQEEPDQKNAQKCSVSPAKLRKELQKIIDQIGVEGSTEENSVLEVHMKEVKIRSNKLSSQSDCRPPTETSVKRACEESDRTDIGIPSMPECEEFDEDRIPHRVKSVIVRDHTTRRKVYVRGRSRSDFFRCPTRRLRCYDVPPCRISRYHYNHYGLENRGARLGVSRRRTKSTGNKHQKNSTDVLHSLVRCERINIQDESTNQQQPLYVQKDQPEKRLNDSTDQRGITPKEESIKWKETALSTNIPKEMRNSQVVTGQNAIRRQPSCSSVFYGDKRAVHGGDISYWRCEPTYCYCLRDRNGNRTRNGICGNCCSSDRNRRRCRTRSTCCGRFRCKSSRHHAYYCYCQQSSSDMPCAEKIDSKPICTSQGVQASSLLEELARQEKVKQEETRDNLQDQESQLQPKLPWIPVDSGVKRVTIHPNVTVDSQLQGPPISFITTSNAFQKSFIGKEFEKIPDKNAFICNPADLVKYNSRSSTSSTDEGSKQKCKPRVCLPPGYQDVKSSPERVDIYLFDHQDSRYFQTTDNPPIVLSEMVVHKAEDFSTRCWAEVFGVFHLLVAIVIAFILQLIKFVLVSIVRPLVTAPIQIFSDYVFKPFLTIVFNGLIQPPIIFLYNIATSVRDLACPIAKAVGYFLREFASFFSVFRLIDIRNKSDIPIKCPA